MFVLGVIVLICYGCGSPSWQIEIVECPQELSTYVDSLQIELLVAGQQSLAGKFALDQSSKSGSFRSQFSTGDLKGLFRRDIDSERDSILIRFSTIIGPQLIVYRDSAGQAIVLDSANLTVARLQSITCKEVIEMFSLDPKVAYSFERRGQILKTETHKLPADPKKRGNIDVVRRLKIDYDPGGTIIECPPPRPCDYRRPDSTQ